MVVGNIKCSREIKKDEDLENVTGLSYITGDSREVRVDRMMSSEAWGRQAFKEQVEKLLRTF